MRANGHLRVGACLSLTGRFSQFGTQAANALRVWRDLDAAADLVIEDDRSDPQVLGSAIKTVASQCDVLLGPYSTQLMRQAGRLAAESGWLLWNHGGSGDDVEAANPGHVVSILTPTSRYAEPFLKRMASEGVGGTLWIVHGDGRFARQVAHGAETMAHRLEIKTVVAGPSGELAPHGGPWYLLTAGTFEDDVEIVRRAIALSHPPRLVCSVAAGVRAFAEALGRDPSGIFGIAQWFPGVVQAPTLGPDEATLVTAYANATGMNPDYPAVQAVAAALIAVHTTRQAGGTSRDLVWPIATRLETSTLFGAFAVDPISGTQLKHEAVLMRWADHSLALA
jgi:ABC-type branched-subunit amino acid transport system substrate-binding protein